MAAKRALQLPDHGQFVFVHGHVRTNQIVYSLTRSMDNTNAMKQLPFLGKKTKPPSLRRDMWRPLATISFPSGAQGLEAYQQLREFRKRHEHEWDPADFSSREKKVIGRELRDQKANSIADLAAVLLRQEQTAKAQAEDFEKERQLAQSALQRAEARLEELRAARRAAKAAMMQNQDSEAAQGEAKTQYKNAKAEKMRIKRQMQKPVPHKALAGQYDPLNDGSPVARRGHRSRLRVLKERPRWSMDGVKVHWANILDAEFAETWPESVTHLRYPRDKERLRNAAPHVPPPPKAPSEVEARMKMLETGYAAPNIAVQPSAAARPKEADQPQEEQSRLRKLIDRLQFGAR